jgi:ATP-dependent RNA helicase DeaD
MQDIQRYFEYIDKEELIKKIVSMEFGKFLSYYADAPEIEEVNNKKEERRGKREEGHGRKQPTPTSKGYKKLFINLGKRDGFYPGELMQTLNRFVGGRQEVGHIDLLDTISYFEVPEKDAKKVTIQLTGIRYKGRTVRCNDADEGGKPSRVSRDSRSSRSSRPPRDSRKSREASPQKTYKKEDWMKFLKGEEPDFSEEGWAIRKPRKKNK